MMRDRQERQPCLDSYIEIVGSLQRQPVDLVGPVIQADLQTDSAALHEIRLDPDPGKGLIQPGRQLFPHERKILRMEVHQHLLLLKYKNRREAPDMFIMDDGTR